MAARECTAIGLSEIVNHRDRSGAAQSLLGRSWIPGITNNNPSRREPTCQRNEHAEGSLAWISLDRKSICTAVEMLLLLAAGTLRLLLCLIREMDKLLWQRRWEVFAWKKYKKNIFEYFVIENARSRLWILCVLSDRAVCCLVLAAIIETKKL